MALANQVPTFENPTPYPNTTQRQIDDRYDVERLAVQHVLQIPVNNSHRDQLLQDTDHIIQVQKRPIQANSPRFFAVVESPGVLKIETWVEVAITEATLQNDGWLRQVPGPTTGALTYNCVACQESSYVINFWV